MDWKFEKICIQYLTQGWNCNIILFSSPKYRRQLIYGRYKASIGRIIRDLYERKSVTIYEATMKK